MKLAPFALLFCASIGFAQPASYLNCYKTTNRELQAERADQGAHFHSLAISARILSSTQLLNLSNGRDTKAQTHSAYKGLLAFELAAPRFDRRSGATFSSGYLILPRQFANAKKPIVTDSPSGVVACIVGSTPQKKLAQPLFLHRGKAIYPLNPSASERNWNENGGADRQHGSGDLSPRDAIGECFQFRGCQSTLILQTSRSVCFASGGHSFRAIGGRCGNLR